MKREQLLNNAKQILFNTDMVRAILEGRKTVTRRVIKKDRIKPVLKSDYRIDNHDIPDSVFIKKLVKMPYEVGDILYVRETWAKDNHRYMYRANYSDSEKFYQDGKEVQLKWKPSIHMPKEVARIFLKVTDVRVERLQDMDKMDALKEGIDNRLCINLSHALTKFKKLWNSTIKKSDIDLYGWDANPWVWVIEFERI